MAHIFASYSCGMELAKFEIVSESFVFSVLEGLCWVGGGNKKKVY